MLAIHAISGVVQVADFGLLIVIWDSPTMIHCGTLGYTASDVTRGKRYSKSVDMWALDWRTVHTLRVSQARMQPLKRGVYLSALGNQNDRSVPGLVHKMGECCIDCRCRVCKILISSGSRM